MTVVAAATSLIEVTQSREGLGNTGIILLVGPNRRVSKTEIEKDNHGSKSGTYPWTAISF
jgi:hypothetical protein